MPVQFFFRKESAEAIPPDTPREMLPSEAPKYLVPDIIFLTSWVEARLADTSGRFHWDYYAA